MGKSGEILKEKKEANQEEKMEEKKETPTPASVKIKHENSVSKVHEVHPPPAEGCSFDVEENVANGGVLPKEEETEEDTPKEIKFSASAELFQGDEKKDWKPRGRGRFQILYEKKSKNFSVEMKRHSDNTCCAKHSITKEMQLMGGRGSYRSFIWAAMDSSDNGSERPVVFGVRFEDDPTGNEFLVEFEKAQTLVVEAGKGKDKKKKKKEESKKERD